MITFLGDIESAVPIYIEFCKDDRAVADKASLCRAYITLGNYYERHGQFDEASHYAYKCLSHDDVKIEAQALLDTIKNKRNISHLAPSIGPIIPAPEAQPTQATTSNETDNNSATSPMEISLDMELSNIANEEEEDDDDSSTDTSE